jgi:hypothetical protein
MEKDKIMTIYFISGLSIRVEFCDKKLKELIESLKNWESTLSHGPELGVNFHHVTHYTIEEQ